jgi:CO/xanthine dehydrogenase FAD-binding subunit
LEQALKLCAGRDLEIIAGGTDVYPSTTSSALHRDLLDITRIAGLSDVDMVSGGWRIGAAATWSDIANADLPTCFAGLQQAAVQVGSVQIQNAGTIGGNLCNASPAADGVPPLLALGARVELRSLRATRQVPLEEFLLGVRKTMLEPGEMMTAIIIPSPPDHTVGVFEKLGSREYLVISICMTSAVIGVGENGLIDFARVAVGACSAVACRVTEIEDYLVGRSPTECRLKPEHLASLTPIDDIRGSSAFRYEAATEQCLRAVRRAGREHG